MTQTLDQLVTLPAGFKPSVQLPNDFLNETINASLLANFLVTEQSVKLLAEIARSQNPNSTERARMLHGTYGTGKSDLLLMLANYYVRTAEDPVMQPLYARISAANQGLADTIRNHRAERNPYLVVLLQASTERPFPGFVLYGLQRALDQAGLSHLMSETRYAAATQRIRDWQTERPDIYARFEQRLREYEAKEIDGLIVELRDASADLAFQAFQRTFQAITGTEFSIYEYDQPEVTYKQVARSLVRQGTHSGILIIIDEFSELLRRFARVSDAQAEALVLQNLAEAASSSDKDQIHFLVASLEPFSSTAARSGASDVDKIIERIGGRFKQSGLQVQGSEELLRGALQRTPETHAIVRLPNRQRDELIMIAEKLWGPRGRPRTWVREVIVEGTFPLHPITTYLLPELNQKVAQNQRTMFLFLSDPQGLPAELARTPLASQYAGWSNLITPDVLFDYFRESIEARYEEIVDAYRRAEMHLQAATVDTTLARRVLKVIAVCEVTSPQLSPTRHVLQQALNLPDEAAAELQAILHMLDAMNAIYVPGEAGGAYGLLLGDRVSPSKIRRLLAAKAAELAHGVSVETLNTTLNWQARSIEAEDYNRTRGSARKLHASYVTPAALKDEARAKRALANSFARMDGAVFYVITDSETERQEALTLARQLTAPVSMQRLVVAIPEKPTTVLGLVQAYQALVALRADPSLSDRERAYLSQQGRIGQEHSQALSLEIARLNRQDTWSWCYGGELVPITKVGPAAIASRAMERTFPDTPKHAMPMHLKADSLVKVDKMPVVLQDTIEQLLNQPVRVPRSSSTKGKEWIVIRNGVVQMGLLRAAPSEPGYDVFTLAAPDAVHQASWRVWHQFEQLEKNPSWSKVLETLRNPPFGLYDSLILIFAASFLTLRAAELTITRSNTRLPLTTDTIASLVSNPQGVTIKLQPLGDLERRWLDALITRGLSKKLDTGSGPLRERVAGQIRQWLTGLKLPLLAEQLELDELRRFLPALPDPQLTAVQLLLRQSKSADLSGVLLDDLPQALGLPADHATWDAELLNDRIETLVAVMKATATLATTIEAQAARAVAAIFGAQYPTAAENWQAIFQWRNTRNAVNAPDLPSEPRRLFHVVNDYNGTIKSALLNDFAGSLVPNIGAYDSWPSLQKLTELTSRIEKAIQVIDEHWRRNAPQEQVWLNGVAQAALGRTATDLKPLKIGESLAQWVSEAGWAMCADRLRDAELHALYPERDAAQTADIGRLLRRRGFDAAQWTEELSQRLASDFGVAGWNRADVEQGRRRFAAALVGASEFNERLRRHVLQQLSVVFRSSAEDAQLVEDSIQHWLTAHPIPAENDLSEHAQIFLRLLSEGGALDTVLTERLPRAYPEVGNTYRQWQTYAVFDVYLGIVTAAVVEIAAYTPLTAAQERWFTTLVEQTKQLLARPARELHQRVTQVSIALAEWQRELHLPAFVQQLTGNELREIAPDARPETLAAAHVLLTRPDPDHQWLLALPATLDGQLPIADWTIEEVEALIPPLELAITFVQRLSTMLIQQLAQQVGAVFGGNGAIQTTATAASFMRTWRKSLVVLNPQQLSEPARSLAELLQSTEEPGELMLRRLPQRIADARVPYEYWQTWSDRLGFLQNLDAAAREIERAGKVTQASDAAHHLWEQLRTQLTMLADEDRRWLIKQFDDTFRQ